MIVCRLLINLLQICLILLVLIEQRIIRRDLSMVQVVAVARITKQYMLSNKLIDLYLRVAYIMDMDIDLDMLFY